MSSSCASHYYYSEVSFSGMVPIALVYNLASNFIITFLLRPFGWFPHPSTTIPTSTGDNKHVRRRTTTKKKLAIVTGSNTGIGYETAQSLVIDHGYDVIVACRSDVKGRKAVDRINANLAKDDTSSSQSTGSNEGKGRAVFVTTCDLSNVNSVRNFATAVQRRYAKLDVLVNNAGRNTSGPSSFTTTSSSSNDSPISENNNDDSMTLDLCFQTNFLGHFVLTRELLSLLQESGGGDGDSSCGTIINVSSVMHHFVADSVRHMYTVEGWKGIATYGRVPDNTYSPSKLAALLFTQQLNRRYNTAAATATTTDNSNCSRGRIRSITVNPGAVNSDIWRDFPRWMIPLFRVLYLNSQQGCQTTVAAAVLLGDVRVDDDDDDDNNDIYLQPYWLPQSSSTDEQTPFPVLEMMGPFVGYRMTKPRLPVDSNKMAESLWKASEELTGCVFPT